MYRTGWVSGSTSNCVASHPSERRAADNRRVLHRSPGLAYRFFSVVDLKRRCPLAEDGLWPNAAPDERLLMWATNERLELTSEPAEVRLPLPEGEERPATTSPPSSKTAASTASAAARRRRRPAQGLSTARRPLLSSSNVVDVRDWINQNNGPPRGLPGYDARP